MSQKDKLIQKLKAKLKSFTFDDAEVLWVILIIAALTKAGPAGHE